MNKRFVVLDSFRGLFAVSIVLLHLCVVNSFGELSFFREAARLVEFFFVLSGFVITHSYAYRNSLDLRSFAISRTFRIFPLHVTMLIVFVIIELLLRQSKVILSFCCIPNFRMHEIICDPFFI